MKKTFLVGGAVRDKLLGYPCHERDWVVVGATPEEMLAEGFKPVGKDFPVFLHPQTNEEYALARTERKTAPGYTGFVFHTDPGVTLEDDLRRRDLTINAIAQAENGEIVDPHGGRRDLKERLLRHVSSAFTEDPVRILRVARFAARYHHLGFQVAPETLELMRAMVDSGEVSHLVAQRVWREMERALSERNPQVFVEVLRNCGALAVILPEVDALFGIPQPAAHHPEIDCGTHCLLSLEEARKISDDSEVMFATLVHDLGKATTPKEQLPRHIGHEQRSLKLIGELCDRLAVPKKHRQLALSVALDHSNCHRAMELKPATILKLLQRLNAFRRPGKLQQFLICCEADARGRTGFSKRHYPQANYLRKAYHCCLEVEAKDVIAMGARGKQIGERLQAERIHALQEFKLHYTVSTPL